ncbi:MAG: DUF2478 domain-containing protein [Piscinibacter sp.]|nr:DUF2478 domain-containing protein [Piscinibacter sp.]
MSDETDAGPRAAAILDDGSGSADALLASIASAQRRAGRRVRGLLMTHPVGAQNCAAAMVLVDLETRDEYLVSQPLGQDSQACRADPQGFARASVVLRRAADEQADLVISNRFGGLEAGGGGFCSELLELMSRDVPVLTVVSPRHVEAWQEFTGGAPVMPPQAEAITRWLAQTVCAA